MNPEPEVEHMATEYEISADLLFWGDVLDSKRLADDLKLNVDKQRAKGEPVGGHSGGLAKTGLLSCKLAPSGSRARRDPEVQFVEAVRALKQLAGPLKDTYGVASAALHVSIYYEKRAAGVADFEFLPELVELLANYGIELKFTILP
jgi:hypothetical protein